MRRLALACVVLGSLALPPSAGAYVERPTIHEGQAFEHIQHFLAKNYPGWRTRKYGYIDCRPGRVNRYTWSCAAGWIRGYNCWQGRAQIENEYSEEGVVYYAVNWRAKRCL